jgi:Ca2+-binding RTX toxin-like protein
MRSTSRRRLGVVALSAAAAGCLLVGAVGWAPSAQAAAPRCDGVLATIVGTPRSEVIRGTPGRDVVVALGGSDNVDSGGGPDLVCGGGGADVLRGGRGPDRLLGGADALLGPDDEGLTHRIGDRLTGGGGDDVLVPGRDDRPADEVARDLLSWENAPAAVEVDLERGVAHGQGSGHDRIVGTRLAVLTGEFADVVRGSDRNDQMATGDGRDRVVAGPGDDRVVVDDQGPNADHAADVVMAGPGDDSVDSSRGRDRLLGGGGRDVLADQASTVDRLRGGDGPDLLVDVVWTGTAAEQLLAGGPGRDQAVPMTHRLNPDLGPADGRLDLAEERLVFVGALAGRATVTGIEVVDLVRDGASWEVWGTRGADEVSAAGEWGTVFHARAGDDVFAGSAGDDRYEGGPGHDVARFMGVGVDTCVSVEVLEQPDCENVLP